MPKFRANDLRPHIFSILIGHQVVQFSMGHSLSSFSTIHIIFVPLIPSISESLMLMVLILIGDGRQAEGRPGLGHRGCAQAIKAGMSTMTSINNK